MINWIKKLFKKKRYSKFIFRSITLSDIWLAGDKIPKKFKYKFIAVIEIPDSDYFDVIAEGYKRGIGIMHIEQRGRVFDNATFFKYYEKPISLEQLKQDFLEKLDSVKKYNHYEEIK